MTYALALFLLGTTICLVALYLFVRVALDSKQRILITVARPTSNDGETVQITSNVRSAASSVEIASYIEKSSLAIQGRMTKQNEILLDTHAKEQHNIWLRIREKLDLAEKENRKGLGVLSKEERNWWIRKKNDFTREGPVELAKEPVAAEG
jgi:hypothetical protein